MKIFLPLIILIFGFSVFGQQAKTLDQIKKEIKTYKLNRFYAARYDQPKDTTMVSIAGLPIGGTAVTYAVDFYFKGQELKETPDPLIWKFIESSQRTQNSLSDLKLFVLADGKKFEIKEGLQRTKINSEIVSYIKTTPFLFFVVSRSDLQEIANSKVIEIKLGDKTYTLDANQQQILKDTLKISELK